MAEITDALIDSTVAMMPQHAVCMNLFEKINIPKGHNSALIPRQNSTFTVQTPTEGDEIVTNSQFDLTSTTISPTLRVIKVRISERAKYFSKEDVTRLVSKELARAEGQDLDQDLLAEFVNFGITDVGTTNTDLVLSVLRTARRALQDNSVANGGPAENLVTVLSPIGAEDLVTNLGVQGVVSSNNPWIPAGLSEQFIREYMVQGVNLVGVPIFVDGYMTVDGNSDKIGAMASRQALQWVVSKDWDMRTFEESDWVGVILRAVADYNSGVGKFANWGVPIIQDDA
ncbi:MAG: hypothetical protein NUW22_14610 [Acidobacteria bacterium]|nr:hypothetical protein [Acidobacteriota bacterium]